MCDINVYCIVLYKHFSKQHTSFQTITQIFTRSSAVAMIADHRSYDIQYSYRPLYGISVVSISIYLFTVSNWSLLLMPVSFLAICCVNG